MALADNISIHIHGHGWYQTSAERMDLLIERCLPASVAGLRQQIIDRGDYPAGHYDDLHTITECLMILAELDGFATN